MQVLKEVDWQVAVAEMSKPLQLRLALVLLALYKAGEDDAQPAASQAHRWVWDLLQGPVGSALTSFAAPAEAAHSGQEAHKVACSAHPVKVQFAQQRLSYCHGVCAQVCIVPLNLRGLAEKHAAVPKTLRASPVLPGAQSRASVQHDAGCGRGRDAGRAHAVPD